MKNRIFTIITALILISCSSTKKITEKRCKSILKNDYKTILEEKFESIVDNDTIFLNEVKYECVHTAMYTKKGMYDKFGKWNQEIYPKGRNHPILLWNNVKLFPNDTTEFIVATNGLESVETIYASVLVFDKKNKDLLSDQSEYKTKLIEYFSEMIKTNNSKKRDFYEIYWKTVDPKRWEQIKQYQKNK
jgi:hypothetical protein